MSSSLRRRLQEITCGTAPVEDHPRLIEALAVEMSHSIRPAPQPSPCLPIASYNCFEFALGLAGRREVRLISEHLPSTFCNGEFARHLVASVLMPVTSPSIGELVLYHDDQQITHAGLIEGKRVLSKWGRGHLWLHDLLEVPTKYGDLTSFYRAPVPTEALAQFLEFAREREGRELVDSILQFETEA
jgi:hypothetical protein